MEPQYGLLPTDEFNRVIIPVKRGEENTDYVNASFIDVSAVCVPRAPNTLWRFIWALHSPHPSGVGKVIFESIISSELIPTLDLSCPREQGGGSRGYTRVITGGKSSQHKPQPKAENL